MESAGAADSTDPVMSCEADSKETADDPVYRLAEARSMEMADGAG